MPSLTAYDQDYEFRPLGPADWETYRAFQIRKAIAEKMNSRFIDALKQKTPEEWKQDISIPGAPVCAALKRNDILGYSLMAHFCLKAAGVDHYTAEMAIEIIPEHQGKGIGTQLYNYTVRYAAKYTEYDLLAACIRDSNVRSERAALKAGFENTGIVIDPDDAPDRYLHIIDLNRLRDMELACA